MSQQRGDLSGLVDRFDALLAHPVGTRSIAILRICVGLIAFWLLRPIATAALGGRTYLDRFHDPFFDLVPRLPETGFTVLITAGALAAPAMAIGLATRWASVVTTAALGYYLAASTVHLHNNRAYLFAILVGISLAPAGRSWSVDQRIASRRGRARDEVMAGWPLWLLRFTCSLVYAASGLSKLVDPDWFGGTVTWGRIVTHETDLRASVLPGFTVDLLLERSFHAVAAKALVLTELFIAAGLWWRRTRWWAVATAVVFHISIELSARVETFSYLAIAVLIVWADPDLDGVRDVAAPWGRRVIRGGPEHNARDTVRGADRKLLHWTRPSRLRSGCGRRGVVAAIGHLLRRNDRQPDPGRAGRQAIRGDGLAVPAVPVVGPAGHRPG